MRKRYREPAGERSPQLEEEILRSWDNQGILRKIQERMKGGQPLVFCEGPPTANSRPNIRHALTRAAKDAFLRYYVMTGREVVPYIGGWDCHGLPVEIEVERALGIGSKKEIEALGIEKFNSMCRESVLKYKADWERMSRRIGYWIDFERAYMTMSKEYIESVWWSLKQLHSKSLLVKGRGVVPYCSRCGTTLSSHEVALGYKDAEDRFVIVRFPVKGLGASLLVWTASPWMLAACAGLAVDRYHEYSVVELGGERLIISSERLVQFAPGARVVQRLRGSELVGKETEPPFAFGPEGSRTTVIIHSSEASKDEGTGAISLAPQFGSVDYALANEIGLAPFDPLDGEGRFTRDVPELEGRFARDADSEVMRMVEARGLLHQWGVLRHSSPFCWRCGTPLIYRAMDSWSVLVSEAKQMLVALNSAIRWVPESFKEGRFGNFLQDARDWNISRDRYWGTPLPIWTCGQGHTVCVGSFAELESLSGKALGGEFDPHRPGLDSITLRCPDCGNEMRRERFVIDCWYDSGCAPFAQYHYPFENISEFDTHRSVDFIAEGVEQTRGWFYTQHALATLLFQKPAFTSVLALGQMVEGSVRAKGGKRPEEMADPEVVFSDIGADASRMFLLESPVWQPLEFSEAMVRESASGTLTTLQNVYAFFSSNANAYGFEPQLEYERTHDLDRWIISRLHSTAMEAREGFDSLEVHRAVRALRKFADDLSGWYVRRSRRRFWEENDPLDRFSAHCTLYDSLLMYSKLLAPVAPFMSDWIYRSLGGPKESVHLEDYPRAEEDLINRTLEQQMTKVITAVEAGRLARQKVNVKLRQPLHEVIIAAGENDAWVLRRFERMISDELNVKRVEVIESRERMLQYSVAANLRVLGPKLKDAASDVSKLLGKVDENELVRRLKATGKIRLGGFDLTEEDVIISEKDKPGYSHASVDDMHVYMALEVTQNLRLEGLAREVIRRIQHMRKEQGLDFDSQVEVLYSGHRDIESAITAHSAHIAHETHASRLARNPEISGGKKWVINRMPLELLVRRSAP